LKAKLNHYNFIIMEQSLQR